MTQQLQGEVLFAGTGVISAPSECVYSPWMKCRGSIVWAGGVQDYFRHDAYLERAD
jgi:hypothetical protein